MVGDVMIGDTRIMLSARPEGINLVTELKAAYVLARLNNMPPATEAEFRGWMSSHAKGRAVLQMMDAGQIPEPDTRLTVDPLNAADEARIVSRLAAERGQTAKPATPMPYKAKPIRQKVADFLRAVSGPTAPPDVSALRLSICDANTCGHLKRDNGKRYCGACGCGKWRLSELSKKTTFANLECPCGLWEVSTCDD